MKTLISCLVALLLTMPAFGQAKRPVPYPVIPTPQFERALEKGTRSPNGMPGPNYWANSADYQIEATLDPATAVLTGQATIVYQNNSPNELESLAIHLRQNLHAEGSVRNRPQKLTGGVKISKVEVNGTPLAEQERRGTQTGYRVNGTIMTIQLEQPLLSGQSVSFSIGWQFKVPEAGAPRMGQDGEIFFVAYWYPQVAVYDDLYGWVADQYMGNGEFYQDHGTFDVKLTVPEGFLVDATGELLNPKAVLSEQSRSRLAKAAQTREIINIVTEADRQAGISTTKSSNGLTWHFKADQVRDFAFGTSDKYVWDATSAHVGDLDGDGESDTSMIYAFYRPGTGVWHRSAEFSQYSIEYLSKMFFPYPYPHMTAVEGVVGGGMEFPMMTHIGGGRNDRSLFGVTFHEIAHMWFPMIVAQNEKAYTWMDEGLTSFNTAEARRDFFDDQESWSPERQSYYRIAGTGFEVEPMRHGDQYPYGTSARGIASYNKPAVALHALRGIVGQDDFMKAYRAYADRWKWKHPTPYDLFNTFEDVLGQDLDWFWTTMFFETWTLDQGIKSVEQNSDGVFITIEDHGLSPMPSPIRVTYEDGTQIEKTVPVDLWLEGARETTLTFDPGNIKNVEIDPNKFMPDINRENNVWTGNTP